MSKHSKVFADERAAIYDWLEDNGFMLTQQHKQHLSILLRALERGRDAKRQENKQSSENKNTKEKQIISDKTRTIFY